MVLEDVENDERAMAEWKEKKKIDLMHVNSEAPSKIEN